MPSIDMTLRRAAFHASQALEMIPLISTAGRPIPYADRDISEPRQGALAGRKLGISQARRYPIFAFRFFDFDDSNK
jgi:hypothetical protein